MKNKNSIISVIAVFFLVLSFNVTQAQLYDVAWTSLVNSTYNASTKVLSNTGTSTWGTSGASSTNTIAVSTNGTLQYNVANTSDVQFGLSPTDANASPNTIHFSFRIEGGNIFIYQSGNMIGYYGSVAIGLRMEITRSGSNILYKINGSTVYGFGTNPATPLIADVALKNGSSSLGLIQMSVPAPTPPPVPFEDVFYPVKNKLDGGYTIIPSDNILRVAFTDKYAINSTYSFKIYSTTPNDINHADYRDQSDYSGLSKTLGDNRLELSVSSLNSGIYVFEIVDDKGKKQFLKFKK